MDFLKQRVPEYLLSKKNIIGMVVFTAIFALLFINAYRPFNVDQIYPEISKLTIFLVSSVMILVGLVVVAVSRVLLYHIAKKHSIRIGVFILWIAAEIIVMAAVYTFLASIYLQDLDKELRTVMINTLRNTTLVIAIPYAMSILYFQLHEYSEKLKMVDVLQQAAEEAVTPSVLSFYDSKGEMKFSIKRENLLYVEAADNYVNIWYTNKNKVEHFLLRTSLKVLEGYNLGGGIYRCHRSYIVNFDNVSLIRREKDGVVYAEFGMEGVENIPISASYSDVITKAFLK